VRHRPWRQQPLRREVFELRILHDRQPPIRHRAYGRGRQSDFSFLSPSFSLSLLRHDEGWRRRVAMVTREQGRGRRHRQQEQGKGEMEEEDDLQPFPLKEAPRGSLAAWTRYRGWGPTMTAPGARKIG
jgi:hypothetical protein